MSLLKSQIGRKIFMALTGQVMILFVVAHLLGNSTIYAHWLNAYAAGLHAFPPLLWTIRIVLIASVFIHAYLGIVITIENRRAKPRSSVVERNLSATFVGRNMIWTGALVAVFIVYHLLHFTFQTIDPSTSALRNMDAMGRPDVYLMVVRAFRHISLSALYIFSLAALLLHLMHGIQSSFQTWGLNSEGTFPAVRKGGILAAAVFFLGYTAIPVVIVLRILKP